MDPYLLKHLKDAWRGDLAARRHVLAWLRAQGHSGLAAALEPAFSPAVIYPDFWTLDQISSVAGLSNVLLNDIMPWRSPEVAAAAMAARLQEASARPWEVYYAGEQPPRLIVRPPAERRDAGGGMNQADRLTLGSVLCVPAGMFRGGGMTLEAGLVALRGYLLRAEGRDIIKDPSEPLTETFV